MKKEETHARCASCLCSLVKTGNKPLYIDSFGPLCEDCHGHAEDAPRRCMLPCIGGPLDRLSVSWMCSGETRGFTVKGGHYLIQDLAHVGQRFVYIKDKKNDIPA